MHDSPRRSRRVPPPPQVASAVGCIGAARRWAGTTRADRRAGTAAARAAYDDRWLKLAKEQYPDLSGDDLARTAEHIKSEHYRRMQLKAMATRKKTGHRRQGGGVDAT